MRSRAVASALCGAMLWLGCGVIVSVPDHAQAEHVEPGSLACEAGFGDCNDDIDDGCETDLATDDHCGACDVKCVHGSCVSSSCVCDDHYADCDGDKTDGCEASLDYDAANCGACGVDCTPGGCVAGRCQPAELVAFPGYYSQVDFILKGSTLYYGGDGGIYTASIDAATPSAPTEPVMPRSAAVTRFLLQGDRVVWAEWQGDGNGAIWSGKLSGDDAVKLVALDSDESWGEMSAAAAHPIAMDADYAYAVRGSIFNGAQSLHRYALDGSSDDLLVADPGSAQAAFPNPWIALDQGTIFWRTSAHLVRYDLATGAAQTSAVFAPGSPVVAGDGILCGVTMSAPMDAMTTVLCGDEAGAVFKPRAEFPTEGAAAITVTNDRVFIEDLASDRIFGAQDGAPTEKVALTEGYLFSMQDTGEDLYWSTSLGIYRLRHPFGPKVTSGN